MICQGVCKNWHGMINFIRSVPRYAIADRCHRCDMWYPKNMLIRCPCCNSILRIKRKKFNEQRYIVPVKNNQEIIMLIENAMSKGWTLLNRDIWKAIKDHELLVSKQRLDRKKRHHSSLTATNLI